MLSRIAKVGKGKAVLKYAAINAGINAVIFTGAQVCDLNHRYSPLPRAICYVPGLVTSAGVGAAAGFLCPCWAIETVLGRDPWMREFLGPKPYTHLLFIQMGAGAGAGQELVDTMLEW